jgi:hypothetical protein
MTALTNEALAALDAVMAKATPGEWPESVVFIRNLMTRSSLHGYADAIAAMRDNTIAIVALHNNYAALRATIDAERARADKLTEALRACRRATLHGADEPRHNVREIVDEAFRSNDHG